MKIFVSFQIFSSPVPAVCSAVTAGSHADTVTTAAGELRVRGEESQSGQVRSPFIDLLIHHNSINFLAFHAMKTRRKARNATRLWLSSVMSLWHKSAGISHMMIPTNQSTASTDLDQLEWTTLVPGSGGGHQTGLPLVPGHLQTGEVRGSHGGPAGRDDGPLQLHWRQSDQGYPPADQ